MMAHVIADLRPDREKHALALVVAGTVLVRLAEVACHDRAIDGAHDLSKGDLLGGPRQHVTASDAPLGPDEARALQGEEDLLEVWLREARPFRDVPNRRRGCLA